MTWIYRRHKEEGVWLYSVGYFEPVNREQTGDYGWVPVEDTSNEWEARALVNYLNGGSGGPFKIRADYTS